MASRLSVSQSSHTSPDRYDPYNWCRYSLQAEGKPTFEPTGSFERLLDGSAPDLALQADRVGELMGPQLSRRYDFAAYAHSGKEHLWAVVYTNFPALTRVDDKWKQQIEEERENTLEWGKSVGTWEPSLVLSACRSLEQSNNSLYRHIIHCRDETHGCSLLAANTGAALSVHMPRPRTGMFNPFSGIPGHDLANEKCTCDTHKTYFEELDRLGRYLQMATQDPSQFSWKKRFEVKRAYTELCKDWWTQHPTGCCTASQSDKAGRDTRQGRPKYVDSDADTITHKQVTGDHVPPPSLARESLTSLARTCGGSPSAGDGNGTSTGSILSGGAKSVDDGWEEIDAPPAIETKEFV